MSLERIGLIGETCPKSTCNLQTMAEAEGPTDALLEVYKKLILGRALWSTLEDHIRNGVSKHLCSREMTAV